MAPLKENLTLHFKKRPSPWTTLWHVFTGVSFTYDENRFCKIGALWPAAKPDRTHLGKYLDICNAAGGDTFPVFYHMTRIFALVMRVLGHRKAPLSVLRTLNTQETISVGRPLKITENPDIKCEIATCRYVKTGLEVDVVGQVTVADETIFKTVKSFLYRGKFNGRVTRRQSFEKIKNGSEVARWVLPGKVGFRFGFLSGDTNPIHYLPRYARLQGFERDFAQPILVMETCLQKIEAAGLRTLLEHPCKVEVHYKGPVYYERENRLICGESAGGHRFDLYCGDNPRPSIMFAIKTGPVFARCASHFAL